MVKPQRDSQAQFCVWTIHSREPLTGISGHPGYLHTHGSLCVLQVLEGTGRPSLGADVPCLRSVGEEPKAQKHLRQEGVELLTPALCPGTAMLTYVKDNATGMAL